MPPRVLILTGATVLWLAIAAAGSGVLLNYGLTPGMPGAPPGRWPRECGLKLCSGGATLVMVVHPHCACSRASLAQLAGLMNAAAGKLQAYVLFVRPPGVAPGWERTDLWQQAVAIAGATVVFDDGGRLATRFGAQTSGQTMLYDRAGGLEFSGGITAARGRYGDSAGSSAIVALLSGAPREISGRTPVYGCALLDHAASSRKTACRR